MGQAKNRGTFEERRQQSIQAEIDRRRKAKEEYEAMSDEEKRAFLSRKFNIIPPPFGGTRHKFGSSGLRGPNVHTPAKKKGRKGKQ